METLDFVTKEKGLIRGKILAEKLYFHRLGVSVLKTFKLGYYFSILEVDALLKHFKLRSCQAIPSARCIFVLIVIELMG